MKNSSPTSAHSAFGALWTKNGIIIGTSCHSMCLRTPKMSFIQVFVDKVKGQFMKWKFKTRHNCSPAKLTDMEPENHPLEKETPLNGIHLLFWSSSRSFFWEGTSLGTKICRLQVPKSGGGDRGFEVMGSDGCWPYWPIAMKWCPFSCKFWMFLGIPRL